MPDVADAPVTFENLTSLLTGGQGAQKPQQGQASTQQGQTTQAGSDDVANTLDSHFQGVLKGHGADFVAAANKYNIDPSLLAAISTFETGNGTSSAARTYNNVGGMMDSSTPNATGFQKFGSVEDGIDAMAQNLRKNYFDQGLTTIEQIANKYAPADAKNDPHGTNGEWPSSVASIMRRLGSKSDTASPLFGEQGDVEASKKPAAYGMRVATQDDVARYDAAVNNGFDPSQLSVADQIAVALAKDPNFFAKDQNFESFYQFVFKPLKDQSSADQFNAFMKNLGPSFADTIQNVGAGIGNVANTYKDQAELAFRKLTGQTHDQAYGDLTDRLAKEMATTAQGAGQAGSDAWNFISGTADGLFQVSEPIAQLAMGKDAQSRDQINRVYAHALQKTVAGQQALANLGNQVQQTVANANKAVGAFADLGNKIANATPDERAASGIATLANPLNFVGAEAGEAVVGAFKPIFFSKGLNAAEEASGAMAKKLVMDSTQILPENPELSSARPGYVETRNLQSNLAPEARAASQDLNNSVQTLNDHLTTMGRISGDPGTATAFAAQALQTVGGAAAMAGQAASVFSKFPEWIGHTFSLGLPPLKDAITDGVRKVIFGTALHHFGPIGAGVEAFLEHAPEVGKVVKDLTSAMGPELMYGEATLPYWARVRQRTGLISKGLASFLDSPAVQTATAVAAGGAAGAATGGVLGGLQGAGSRPGGGLQGFLGGAAQGGIFGMAGGGFGQWQKFQDPNQYLLQARGDWKRYRDMLSQTDRQQFDRLSSTNQLMLAQHGQNFPDLRVQYVNDPNAPSGFHYVDSANRSNIQVNLAAPDSVIRGTLAHELTHAATTTGMMPDILDTLLGNPQRGTKGQFTALDGEGNPVGIDPLTGRYLTDQNFANFAKGYTNLMAQNGLPTAHINDAMIAKEIFAEHGVDYMLSGGALMDSNSAFRPGMFSRNAMKTALAKMGYTFDEAGKMIGAPGGTVSGTGLFSDLQRNPHLNKLAQTFFQTGVREGSLTSEEQPTTRFTQKDMQNPATAERLNNAAEIFRDQNGNALRSPLTGQPVYRTPKQVEEYNAKFADALRTGLSTLSEEQRMDLGMRGTAEGNTFVRYLPDSILDSLAGTNEYNPHQIASLRMLSRVLADKGSPGMEMRFFYHKALTAGKKYRGFEGTEKFATPYGFEITKDNNVNIKSVDFNQLMANYQRVAKRDPYKSLWKNESEFDQDATTYFTNHSKGEPGSIGLGEAKRDAINALGNFQTVTQAEANPLIDKMPQSVRSIIKSYRIDRANQITPTGAKRPFISEEQYYKMNRNYLPRKGEFQSVSPEDFIAGRSKTNRPEFLSELKPEDLTEHQLFTNAAGDVGVALSPQGDIQNVFNNSGVAGAGANAVAHAIKQGGRTLDAFDTGFLPRFYRQFGFKETGRMKFDDKSAPANWNYDKHGRPDVVFMGWDGYPKGPSDAIARANGPEIHWLPNERSTRYSNDWDGQKDASRTFATGTSAYRLPGEGGGSEAYAAGNQPGGGFGEQPRAPVAPDNTAIPVSYTTTRTGKTIEEPIPYGISNAPLVADKQPGTNLQANNFKHVDFLTNPEQQKLTHLDKASAVTDFADKIVKDYDRWKDNDWAKEAKGWYKDVRKYLTAAFGGDRERFAHLLAATSSGQGVVQNWKDALEAYQQYRSGAYDDAIREFKRTGQITEDMKPTKASGAKFGRNSDAVLKVLAGTWLDDVEGPKTPNFFRNLFGRGTDATIDMWAARTMRRLGYEGVDGAPEQWRIQPASETGVSNLDFAFSQQAFRQAADKLGMKPHELQAIMWYAEKHLWAERGWAKGGAQAAKESYVPRLKEFAEQVTATGGPKAPGYLPRVQRYVQGREPQRMQSGG